MDILFLLHDFRTKGSVSQVAITAVASHLHETGEILQTGALLHAQKQ